MSDPSQLNLFDLSKYESPSKDGKPDWAYDVMYGDSDIPTEIRKGDTRSWEEERASDVEVTQVTPISIPDSPPDFAPLLDDTGGRISTPGEGQSISKPESTQVVDTQFHQLN